jgi:hypothetical protein
MTGVTEDGEATFGSTDVTTDSEITVGSGDLTGEGDASDVSIDGESTFGTTDVTSDTDTSASLDNSTGAPVNTTSDDDPTATEFEEVTYTGADSEAEEAELERAGYSIETPGLEDTDTSAGLTGTAAGLESDQITTSPDLPGTEDVGLLESPETASAEDIATDTGDETSSAAIGGTGGFNADDDVVTGSGFEGTQYYADTPADAGWESATATTDADLGATEYADVDAGDTGESLDSTDTTVVAGAAAASATAGAVGGRIKGDASGSCPPDYPIKGNGSSKIYHVPGIPSYRGTKAEWCFASEDAAIEAGFRAPGGHRAAAGRGSSGPATSGGGTSDEAQSDAGLDAPLSADTSPTTLASYPQEADAGTTGAATSEGDDFGSGADDIESLQLSSPDDTTGSSGNVTDAIPDGGVATEQDESFEVNTVTSASADADSAEFNDQGAYAGAVRGDGTRVCPSDYPIKGNATSMIYHSPGRASYESTIAEWCFADEAAAQAAGFRAPKR